MNTLFFSGKHHNNLAFFKHLSVDTTVQAHLSVSS